MRKLGIAWVYIAVALPHVVAQGPGVRDALAAMQAGDFQSAERKLRDEVAAHPDDVSALSLLGVTLDNLDKVQEASEFHRRAVAKAPRSIDVLNNYAAHEWVAGNEQAALSAYLRVLELDPAHYNANLQLARLALKRGNAPDAIRYLDQLPAARRESPEALLVRLEALYRGGDMTKGDQLTARLSEMARSDAGLTFAVVMALSNARQYDKAEVFCENALKAYPTNFNVLYDLGLVAGYAGHFDRAREVLRTALRQQPQNVDVLYALARAEEALKHWETAVRLLAQAARLDPRRTDIEELLAVTTSELGAYDDAIAAWDRYLKLKPDDEIARRERSYTQAQMGQSEKGIPGLERFLERHPDDAVGHYELGQAQRTVDPAKALLHFDKAVALDPDYVPARTARGSLYYQEGKPEASVKDLEFAASRHPNDAGCLDRLGQAYQALDRTADAVRVLRAAAALAPEDSKTLLHLARALADAGKMEESKAVMDHFRQLGPDKNRQLPAGFVEYLNLTEEQRRADYSVRVMKALKSHPDDGGVQLAWLKLLIEEGNQDRAAEAARGIAGLKPDAAVLSGAGKALLAAKQYGAARELLQKAVALAPSASIELDLAMALFRGGDAAQALQELERLPQSARNGDYYLSRAEMLDASHQNEETRATLDRALSSAPLRGDFYLRATSYLVRNDQTAEALRFLDQGARRLPADREILLTRAVLLELVRKTAEADRMLRDIQARWPEWYPAWVTHGIILKKHNRAEEARRAFDTATALAVPADLLRVDLESIIEGTLFR